MSKTILLLLALIFASYGMSPIKFQLGNGLAELTRRGNNYNGIVPVNCLGGVGQLRYIFRNLPTGWDVQNGNTLVIPNIVNVVGTYVIRAVVSD